MSRVIRITANAKITSNATTFVGPDDSETYWCASVYVLGREISTVGINGRGRYKTAKAAEAAAIKEARRALRPFEGGSL